MAILRTRNAPFNVWLNGVNVTGAVIHVSFGTDLPGEILVNDEDGNLRYYHENFEVTATNKEGKEIILYRALSWI